MWDGVVMQEGQESSGQQPFFLHGLGYGVAGDREMGV